MTESAPSQSDPQTLASDQQPQTSNSPATISNTSLESSNLHTPHELVKPRSLTGRIWRWVRYVSLTALALLVGYLSRDWSRPPIWKKRVPIYTMIAGVSEARNEIVLVSQFDQGNEPFDGRLVAKQKKTDPPDSIRSTYESVQTEELTFLEGSANRVVIPHSITIETCELTTGRMTESITLKTDDVYSAAGLNERTITLAHKAGGILQIDRATGNVITKSSFLAPVSLSPTGEYWANRQNVYSTRSPDPIFQLRSVLRSGNVITMPTWSPDGSKFALVEGNGSAERADEGFDFHLTVFDVISKKAVAIPCDEDLDRRIRFFPRVFWLDGQHFCVAFRMVPTKSKPDEVRVRSYRTTATELMKSPTPRFEWGPSRLTVFSRQLPDDTWFVRRFRTLAEWESQLVKLVSQTNIRWLIDLANRYQSNRTTRFERHTKVGDKQSLASVVVNNMFDFRLSERDRYLITSTVVHPSEKLDSATALALTQQWVSVYNFRPAALPTWLFQLIVAAIAFLVLLIATTIVRKLSSIVSRRFFRQRTP